MSLLSDLGTKVGAEFKSHRLRIEALEAADTLDNGGLVDGMLNLSTSLSGNEDWMNSPITIRERGRVSNTQSDIKYSPNLNFHWAGKKSRSLYMDSLGDLYYGEYDSLGNPIGDKVYHSGNLPSSSANYAFWAYHTSGVATSTVNTPIVFNATQTNNNSVYNTTNGRFTAPVSGTYYLEGNLLYRGTSTCEWSFYRNGINTGSRGISYTGGVATASTPHLNAPSSLIIYLNVGDYVDMRIYQIGGGDYYYGQRLAHFAGYLMS